VVRGKRLTAVTIRDILSLLKEDWIPEEKKEQIRNMILDTIDMADQMAKSMAKKMGEQ